MIRSAASGQRLDSRLDRREVLRAGAAASFGLIAPRAAPIEIVARLNAEVRAAVASSEMREVISAQGFEPSASSPEQFSEVIRSEVAKWAQVVKTSGFKAE